MDASLLANELVDSVENKRYREMGFGRKCELDQATVNKVKFSIIINGSPEGCVCHKLHLRGNTNHFEGISGLHVNCKSRLFPVNQVNNMQGLSTTGMPVASLPTKYWDALGQEQKMEEANKVEESIYIPGGRLTLIKSASDALPTYMLSLFHYQKYWKETQQAEKGFPPQGNKEKQGYNPLNGKRYGIMEEVYSEKYGLQSNWIMKRWKTIENVADEKCSAKYGPLKVGTLCSAALNDWEVEEALSQSPDKPVLRRDSRGFHIKSCYERNTNHFLTTNLAPKLTENWVLTHWQGIGKRGSKEDWWKNIPGCIWWTLWKERNGRCFEGKHLTQQDAFQPWEDAECLQTLPGSP
ncbi:hypothetical protein H5410_064498 [Solanum commersonii]|uniref:Uncharacterized protein n=1 Tax=Solanum commersonii TaxID=4109 RepID=A0A9J5VZA6_SOLCO|nr:hypothetical protein H5410_064498 [Solanum commersonii]